MLQGDQERMNKLLLKTTVDLGQKFLLRGTAIVVRFGKGHLSPRLNQLDRYGPTLCLVQLTNQLQ